MAPQPMPSSASEPTIYVPSRAVVLWLMGDGQVA